jgi:hypothetical protein
MSKFVRQTRVIGPDKDFSTRDAAPVCREVVGQVLLNAVNLAYLKIAEGVVQHWHLAGEAETTLQHRPESQ